jgi:hypothetical protein
VLFTLVVSVVGIVKGMDARLHSYIFVSVMLLPLLATCLALLRWTAGEAIDERLQKLATFHGLALLGIDIAFLVVMVTVT